MTKVKVFKYCLLLVCWHWESFLKKNYKFTFLCYVYQVGLNIRNEIRSTLSVSKRVCKQFAFVITASQSICAQIGRMQVVLQLRRFIGPCEHVWDNWFIMSFAQMILNELQLVKRVFYWIYNVICWYNFYQWEKYM